MVLEKAIADPDMRKMLVTVFSDRNRANASFLKRRQLNEYLELIQLKYKPQIYTEEVGTEIFKMFQSMELVPTFVFVDPWGYKGSVARAHQLRPKKLGM